MKDTEQQKIVLEIEIIEEKIEKLLIITDFVEITIY